MLGCGGQRRALGMDLICVGIVVLFLLVSLALATLCERLCG